MAKKPSTVEAVESKPEPVVETPTEVVVAVPTVRKFDVEVPGCPVGRKIHEVTAEDCDLANDDACKAAAVKKYFEACGILKTIHMPIAFEVLK